MRKFNKRENLALILRFFADYLKIKDFNILPQSHVRAYQFQRIKHLINLGYHHTQFYRQKYDTAGIHPQDVRDWQDFKQLPTITRDELVEAGVSMVNNQIDFDTLRLSRSSGSTGKFVTIYLDSSMLITQALQALRMMKEMNPEYSPRDNELLVYTSEYPYSSIGGLYKSIYVDNLLPADQIFKKIQQIRPAIVAVYPSILRELVRMYGSNLRSRGIKTVITNSEHSTQEEGQLRRTAPMFRLRRILVRGALVHCIPVPPP